jgi:tetratricopeptide (TPR) repeat protein
VSILLAALLAAADAQASQLFADGNAAFLSADVSRAVASYEALLSEGIVSTELETNLGAAYLRQGKRGLATLHLERALFLAPSDEDARADLREVRRGNIDKVEGGSDEGGLDLVARILAPLPGTPAAFALLVFWWLFWTLLAARILRIGPSWAASAAAGCLVGSAAAALVVWGAAEGRLMALARGVVISQSAAAREGPGGTSAPRFEIHEGTALRVEDEEPGFLRVKLANGLAGWVPANAVALVVPPGWAGRPVLAKGQP